MVIEISVTDEQYKALAHEIANPQEWLQAIVGSKIHFALERIIKENTDFRPDRVSDTEKLSIVNGLTLKTRATLDAEAKALLEAQILKSESSKEDNS